MIELKFEDFFPEIKARIQRQILHILIICGLYFALIPFFPSPPDSQY